ncbi:hypothetical protein [Streptomyces sp. NPDC096105]|uniref:hypothetical protein n=1 Tax=Streptomyces sp. NPDC096105 TaxID=3366074 RepID=UPI00380C2A0A
MRAPTLRRRTTLGLCALVLSLSFNTACTTEKEKDSGSPTATSSLSAEDKQAKAYDCLRSNGVEVTEGESGGGVGINSNGMSQEKLAEVAEKCGLDSKGPGDTLSQGDKDKALGFARCMRDEGFDYDDPDLNAGVSKAQPVPKGQEEAFAAATEKCQKKAGF